MADVRKLKNDAAAAREHGNYKKALKKYLELEKAEPLDGGWSLRAAEMLRRIGKSGDAVAPLERAVDRYVRAGFVVKAIAACKMILQIDPEHSDSKERLAALNRQRGMPVTADRPPVGDTPRVRLPDSPGAVTPGVGERPAVGPTGPGAVPPAQTGTPGTPGTAAPGVSPGPTPQGARPGPTPQGARPGPTPQGARPGPTPQGARPGPPIPARGTAHGVAARGTPQGAGPPPTPRPAFAPGADPPAAGGAPKRSGPPPIPPQLRRVKPRTIPPGAPLGDVSLKQVVPDARPELKPDGGDSGIFEIPLQTRDVPPQDNPLRRTLEGTPLFSSLGPEGLARLIEVVELVYLGKGEVLFRQGDPGDALYVIAEGAVSVIAEGPPRRHLAKLSEGQFFGEISLVVDQPRSATVQAVDRTQLLKIDREVMSEVVEQEPRVLKALLRFLRARLVHRLIQTHPLFVPLGEDQRAEVIRKFRFLEVEKGGLLVEQGKRARGLFVFLSGEAEAVREQDGEARVVHMLRPGDLAGEMSLLANSEAVATIRVTKRSLALGLPADAFRETIMTHPPVLMVVSEFADKRRRQYEDFLAGTGEYDEGHLTFY